MWNERCIHLLQKSAFLYEESGEVEELKPDELQRNMRALTDVTFDQWCASSQRRAYDKDVLGRRSSGGHPPSALSRSH
jgi:hypothetical protein